MQGAQEVADRLARAPGVLEPPRPDLRVSAAVDPALLAIGGAERLVIAQVAVVAEGVAAGRVVERLRVGERQGREPRRPAQVDERARGLDRPDPLATGVVGEGPDVAVGAEAAVCRRPRRAPAEPRQPEVLELLGERPHLVQPERLRRTDDVVLTHGQPMIRGRPGTTGTSTSFAAGRSPAASSGWASGSVGT